MLEARGTKRNINTVEVSLQGQEDVISTITEPTRQTTQGQNTLGGNAGSQFGRQRTIGAMASGPRRSIPNATTRIIAQTNSQPSHRESKGFMELDSHADTSCIGDSAE